MAARPDMMNTIRVVIMVSRRVGHVTFWVSERTSWRNLNGLTFAIRLQPCLPLMRARRTARNVGSVHPSRLIYTREFRKSPSPGLKRSQAWQEWRDSNPQPPVLETGALAIELHSSGSGCGGPTAAR